MKNKVFKNSIWMMLEKVISIFGLFFVTSYVAKYVGPSTFGEIALSLSIFQVVLTISQLGSSILIFKRVSRKEESGINLINATVFLRAIIYILFSIPVLFYFRNGTEDYYFILASFLSCFFISVDAYAIFFDAKLKSKYNTIINVVALLFSLAIRWSIVQLEASYLYLTIPIVITGMIPYIFRFLVFKSLSSHCKINFRKKLKYSKYLLLSGVSFVISDVSVAIYTRLSLLFLGFLESKHSSGVYSVALTLAGAWSFVLYSIINSNLPAIFAERSGKASIQKAANLNILIILIAIPIILVIIFLSPYLIHVLYGDEYITSYLPMVILSISTLISASGTIAARLIAKYSGYKYLSTKTILVLILSVILNYVLIKEYGLLGAALATIVVEFLSLTIMNYFYKDNLIFKLHLKITSLRTVIDFFRTHRSLVLKRYAKHLDS